MTSFRPLTLLIAILIAGASAAAQEPDDSGSDLALLRGDTAWQVTERSGKDRWDATWTVRSDGKTFDAHWVHQPGGDSGDLKGFARIASWRPPSIVIERPGLGRYTGTLSADGTRISGRMSWSGGTWEVRLPAGVMPVPSQAGGGRQSPKPAPVATAPTAPRGPAVGTGGARVALPGQKWHVVETSGADRWTSEWTVRGDGRSFDATWTHSPGGERGALANFAHIVSIAGSQIQIDRPGLGTYAGTISADRRSVQGKISWSGGVWTVSLSDPLPASLP